MGQRIQRISTRICCLLSWQADLMKKLLCVVQAVWAAGISCDKPQTSSNPS